MASYSVVNPGESCPPLAAQHLLYANWDVERDIQVFWMDPPKVPVANQDAADAL